MDSGEVVVIVVVAAVPCSFAATTTVCFSHRGFRQHKKPFRRDHISYLKKSRKKQKNLGQSNLKFSFTDVSTTCVLVRSMYGSANSFLVNAPRSSRLLNLAIMIASVNPVTS